MGTKTVMLADKTTPFYFITIHYDGIIDPTATGSLTLTLNAGFSGTTSTPTIRINNTLLKAENGDWVYDGQDDLFRQTGSGDHLQLGVWSNTTSGIISYYNGYLNDKFDQLMCYLVYDNAGTAYVSVKMKYGNWTAVDDIVDTTNERFVVHQGSTFYNTIYQVKNDITVTLGYNPSNIAVGTRLYNYKYVALDPYGPGGTTGPTITPTGDFDNTSDPIPPAPLPTLSAVDAKFITMFSPDLTQLQALATYMWGSAFDLDTFKKLFTDPMAAILGLSIVPVQPSVSLPTPVTLGNITTSISMPKITAQYITVSCGTLNVNEYWGAYLDYSPYTKLEIFLPYIGIQTLDADDVMGKSITVTYNIDILSGACVAMLTCGNSVLYSFAGSCATSVPITGRDWTNMINGIIGIATGIAGVAVAGATGGSAVAAGAAGTLLGSTANSLTAMKPNVQRSGTMASAAGMLGIQKPYLILTRPRQALPKNQNTYTGYPSYITQSLESVSGYTIVEEVHLDGVPCTAAEHDEIMSLLKEGVIF